MPTPVQKKKSYYQYLHSDEWRGLREKVLERDENRCTECGSQKSLHVHHLTYRRIFNEALEDLVTLCSSCHGLQHQGKKKQQERKERRRLNKKRKRLQGVRVYHDPELVRAAKRRKAGKNPDPDGPDPSSPFRYVAWRERNTQRSWRPLT